MGNADADAHRFVSIFIGIVLTIAVIDVRLRRGLANRSECGFRSEPADEAWIDLREKT